MHTFVVFGGVPAEVHDFVHKQSAVKLVGADATPLMAPLRSIAPGQNRYSEEHAKELLDKLFLNFWPMARRDFHADLHVLLVYLNHPNSGADKFLETFFPFALAIGVNAPTLYGLSTRAFKEARSDLLENLRAGAAALRKNVAAMRSELTNHLNSTPFLLPMRNFNSSSLGQLVRDAFDSLGSQPNPEQFIQALRKSFEARHPRSKVGTDPRRHFVDGRGLIFAAPTPGGRHAYHREGGDVGHRQSCMLAGRVRLGAPYHASFHYDCRYERGEVGGPFPNCHAAPTASHNAAYVNIAPNDFIR